MVELVCLSAMENEFICNQWERKEVHTVFLCLVQYGTKGKCP
jgi:hypothetical protein